LKPLIGITTSFTGEDTQLAVYLPQVYCKAISLSGGTPVLLPLEIKPEFAKEYTSKLDGILFSGGGDLSPHLFDEDPIRELLKFFTVRDETELALINQARDLRLPVLGICRGCQVINVALGGSLYQDIPSQRPEAIGHYPKGIPVYEPYHKINILPIESRLTHIFKKPSIMTNSFHHQSVKQLAQGLRLTAQSSDGIIEAFEGIDPAWYVHGLQFHPEAMCEKHPEFLGLFADFVNACQK